MTDMIPLPATRDELPTDEFGRKLILPNHDWDSTVETMIADAAEILAVNTRHHSDDACDYASSAFDLLSILNNAIVDYGALLFREMTDERRTEVARLLTDMINCNPLDDDLFQCIHFLASDAVPNWDFLIDWELCPKTNEL